MSHVNVVMYCSVLPSYKSKNGDNGDGNKMFGKDVVINGDDPANKDKIAKFFGD